MIIGYHRKHQRLLSRLENKLDKFHNLQDEADSRLHQQDEKARSLLDDKENLRRLLQEESHRQQTLSSRTAQLRGSVSKLELDWDSLQDDYSTAKKKRDEIVTSIEEFESKHAQAMQVLNEKKATLSTSLSKVLAEIKQANNSTSETQHKLQAAWKRHEDVRLSHNLGSTPPNTCPTLDMGHFQQLLDNEKQATGTEEMSKLTLIAQVAKLRSELITIQNDTSTKEQEKQSTDSRLNEKKKTLTALAENETRRKAEAEKVEDEVMRLQAAHQKKETEVHEQTQESEKLALAVREQVATLKAQIAVARSALAEKNETLSALEDAHGKAGSKWQKKIQVEQSKVDGLSDECDMLSEKIDAMEDAPPAAVDIGVKQRIDQILAGENSRS